MGGTQNLPDASLTPFARATRGVAATVESMRNRHIYTDGALTAQTKVLMALLWSVQARCEPCIEHYAQRATELGAGENAIGEVLAIATTMGACVAETWARKAFDAAANTHGAGCCP